MTLQEILKKALKNSKIKESTFNTIETSIWLSPFLLGMLLVEIGHNWGPTLVSMQIPIVILQAFYYSFNNGQFFSVNYYIQKLMALRHTNQINELQRNFIQKHKENNVTVQDTSFIAQYYLNYPLLCLFYNSLNIQYIQKLTPYLSETNKIVSYYYNKLDYTTIMKEAQKNLTLNLQFLFTHCPSEVKNAVKIRDKFILDNCQYVLKEEDYSELSRIFKIFNRYYTEVAYSQDAIILKHILSCRHIVADWSRIRKELDKQSYSPLYIALREIIDSKSPEQINEFIALNIQSIKTQVEKLFDYTLKHEKDKWLTLKKNFEYLNKNQKLGEFEQSLKKDIPIIIEHDKNLQNLKSDNSKRQTLTLISDIMTSLLKKSTQLIEDMEIENTKNLKIIQKYHSMRQ